MWCSTISRDFQTSAAIASKAKKRLKDTKLKQAPNLRKVSHDPPKKTKKAIDFFDVHYQQIYGSAWHSIRLALFSKPKYAALINNFSAKDDIVQDLKSRGCLSIKDLYCQGKLLALTNDMQFLSSLNVAKL